MKTTLIFAGFAAMILCVGRVSAADLTVITNPGLSISASEVKDIFSGAKQFSGSTKIIPVENAAAQDDFLAIALKMDRGKYNALWAKKSFRDGLNPPAIRSSDVEVIEFVKRTPGAVGYVKSSPSGVNIIKKY